MREPVLVTVDVITPGQGVEAEPVLREIDEQGCLHLMLDDGTELVLAAVDTVAIAVEVLSPMGFQEAA